MGRKETREDTRELTEAARVYYRAGEVLREAARPFHQRAQGLIERERIEACGQVTLFPDRVATPSGVFALTPDVTAGVDHAGAISSRVTVTRLVATGIFALAFKKKQDDRELFLYIDAPAGQHVELCPPTKQGEVRRFAALITTTARENVARDATAREDALALLAEYAAFDRDTTDLDTALERLRAVEQRMTQQGTLPNWHDPKVTGTRGQLTPLQLYQLPIVEPTPTANTLAKEQPSETQTATCPTQPADGRSITAQLEALAELRHRGDLTDTEFEYAKSRVLGV